MTSPRYNRDEEIAKRWLELQCIGEVSRFRNDPPDYVVNGRVAVEVRKLNFPEEEFEEPLRQNVTKALKNLGVRLPDGYTTFVDLHYYLPRAARGHLKLPGKNKKELRIKIESALNSIDSYESQRIQLGPGLSLHTFASEFKGTYRFKLNAVYVLPADTGWDLPDYRDTIANCVREKSQKVWNKNNVEDFDEWWLALVDHVKVGAQLNRDELRWLSEAIPAREFWSRIIVISPENPEWFFELLPLNN